jgi:DNA-binding GntR family transcriptional regulator
MRPNRSVRVPLMTRAKILELRDIRMALEGLAAKQVAVRISKEKIAELRQIALEIVAARERADTTTDRAKIREFHFALYRAADQPTLLNLIEGLWLRTGPYMNLLFPEYMRGRRGQGRARLIRALQSRDALAACSEIENDIREALSYVADLADEAGNIAPFAPQAERKRARSVSKRRASVELGRV